MAYWSQTEMEIKRGDRGSSGWRLRARSDAATRGGLRHKRSIGGHSSLGDAPEQSALLSRCAPVFEKHGATLSMYYHCRSMSLSFACGVLLLACTADYKSYGRAKDRVVSYASPVRFDPGSWKKVPACEPKGKCLLKELGDCRLEWREKHAHATLPLDTAEIGALSAIAGTAVTKNSAQALAIALVAGLLDRGARRQDLDRYVDACMAKKGYRNVGKEAKGRNILERS